MPRPRKPAKVLEALGAFRKNPDRKRQDVEVSDPIGPPASELQSDEVEAYQEICSQAPCGVLTKADTLHVEITARLLAQFRRDPESFNGAKATLLSKMLGQCGGNPTDRLRLSVPVKTTKMQDNPFAQFDRTPRG